MMYIKASSSDQMSVPKVGLLNRSRFKYSPRGPRGMQANALPGSESDSEEANGKGGQSGGG